MNKETSREISKEHILAPDEKLAEAISGEELLSRIIPHIEKHFENEKRYF